MVKINSGVPDSKTSFTTTTVGLYLSDSDLDPVYGGRVDSGLEYKRDNLFNWQANSVLCGIDYNNTTVPSLSRGPYVYWRPLLCAA